MKNIADTLKYYIRFCSKDLDFVMYYYIKYCKEHAVSIDDAFKLGNYCRMLTYFKLILFECLEGKYNEEEELFNFLDTMTFEGRDLLLEVLKMTESGMKENFDNNQQLHIDYLNGVVVGNSVIGVFSDTDWTKENKQIDKWIKRYEKHIENRKNNKR